MIIDKLNSLSDRINQDKRFVNLNSGGCCVFAKLVMNKLKDVEDIGVEILVCSYRSRTYDIGEIREGVSNKGDIKDWNANGLFFDHVVLGIEYGGEKYHYDSTGLYENDGRIVSDIDDDMIVLDGSLMFEEVELLADSSIGWNKMFNRDLIPDLSNIINSELG